MSKSDKAFTAVSAAVIAAVAIVTIVSRLQEPPARTATQAQILPGLVLSATPTVESLRAAVAATGQDVTGVKIDVVEGIVLLKGSTGDRQAIAMVEKTVRDLGATRVANLIEFKQGITDAQLVREAELQLGRTRSLDGSRLAVRAKDGVVTIAGNFETETQKDAAEQIVRRIRGVRQVVRAERLPFDPAATGAGL